MHSLVFTRISFVFCFLSSRLLGSRLHLVFVFVFSQFLHFTFILLLILDSHLIYTHTLVIYGYWSRFWSQFAWIAFLSHVCLCALSVHSPPFTRFRLVTRTSLDRLPGFLDSADHAPFADPHAYAHYARLRSRTHAHLAFAGSHAHTSALRTHSRLPYARTRVHAHILSDHARYLVHWILVLTLIFCSFLVPHGLHTSVHVCTSLHVCGSHTSHLDHTAFVLHTRMRCTRTPRSHVYTRFVLPRADHSRVLSAPGSPVLRARITRTHLDHGSFTHFFLFCITDHSHGSFSFARGSLTLCVYLDALPHILHAPHTDHRTATVLTSRVCVTSFIGSRSFSRCAVIVRGSRTAFCAGSGYHGWFALLVIGSDFFSHGSDPRFLTSPPHAPAHASHLSSLTDLRMRSFCILCAYGFAHSLCTLTLFMSPGSALTSGYFADRLFSHAAFTRTLTDRFTRTAHVHARSRSFLVHVL